jgi:metallo-beta-lactamase class B
MLKSSQIPKWILALAVLAATLTTGFAREARADQHPEWRQAVPPYRIAGNLYYVGSKELASYLVTTPQGLILINSNLTASPAQIRASVEKLGFHFKDVKILLISHAHYDHCAGSARIKQWTGAQYMVMDADVPVIQSGGRLDFQYGSEPGSRYTPTKVDRILHDGSEVRLGDTALVAHKTAGHTKGCTTWTMAVREKGKSLNVVIVGSPNVNSGYKLVNNPKYPQIASDYAQGFRTLKSLPCDIFLGAHPSYFDMDVKYPRFQAGDTQAFVDPAGYKSYIAEREQAFETELAKQRAAQKHSATPSQK